MKRKLAATLFILVVLIVLAMKMYNGANSQEQPNFLVKVLNSNSACAHDSYSAADSRCSDAYNKALRTNAYVVYVLGVGAIIVGGLLLGSTIPKNKRPN